MYSPAPKPWAGTISHLSVPKDSSFFLHFVSTLILRICDHCACPCRGVIKPCQNVQFLGWSNQLAWIKLYNIKRNSGPQITPPTPPKKQQLVRLLGGWRGVQKMNSTSSRNFLARRCGFFMVAFPDFQEEEYDARDGRASGLRFKSRAQTRANSIKTVTRTGFTCWANEVMLN